MVKVFVWGAPVLVHDNLKHQRANLATAPIMEWSRRFGVSNGGIAVFFSDLAAANPGNLIFVDVRDLGVADIARAASVLAAEIQHIWPSMSVEVCVNGASMASRE